MTDVAILLQTRYKNSDPRYLFKAHIPSHPSGPLWDELLRSKEIAVNFAVAGIQITKGFRTTLRQVGLD